MEETNSRRSPALVRTLRELEPTTNAANHEIAHIVSIGGKHVSSYDDRDGSRVSVPAEIVRGNVVTHNHPGGGALSFSDINKIIRDGGAEIRATTPEGKYFSFRPTECADPGIVDALRALGADKNGIVLNMGYQLARKKYGLGNFGDRQMYLEYSDFMRGWYAENAPKYGYIYEEGDI